MCLDFAKRQRPDTFLSQAPEQEEQPKEKPGVTDAIDDKRFLASTGFLVISVPKANEQVLAQDQ